MIELAVILTKRGSKRREQFLGAAGERGDGVIVLARNEAAKMRDPFVHAERRVLAKMDVGAPMVVVVRVAKSTGKLAMAKPCPDCERYLRFKKIQKVFFSNENGKIERLW